MFLCAFLEVHEKNLQNLKSGSKWKKYTNLFQKQFLVMESQKVVDFKRSESPHRIKFCVESLQKKRENGNN